MRRLSGILFLIPILLSYSLQSVYAKSGCCSGHDGVSCSAGAQSNGNVICNDGWRGSSCSYSEMVMCGGITTTTDPTKPPTPKPTQRPTIRPTPDPTIAPTIDPSPSNIPTPTPVASITVNSTTEPPSKPESDSSSTGEAVAGLGTVGGLGWLGFKGIKKIIGKLLT